MDNNTITEYNKQLNDYNKRYNIVLNELVKVFPKKKMYPEYKIYDLIYTTTNENVSKLENDFVVLRTQLETNIQKLDVNINQINDQINEIEKENKGLRKKLNELHNSNDASGGMLSDVKYLYNQQLTTNWILFFTILGISYKYFV